MPRDDSRNTDCTALDVAEHCPLSEDARALLTPDLKPGKYVTLLIETEQYADAIRFTAFNLSRREAVWWGMLCLWEALRNDSSKTSEPIHATFQALVAWLQEPGEANRRAVESAGRNAGITTPHGQLAMAAFFSEGSMSLVDQPDVEPDPWLTAQNVVSVVLAASKIGKPSQIQESQRLFLVLAAELTKGQLPWHTPNRDKIAVTTS